MSIPPELPDEDFDLDLTPTTLAAQRARRHRVKMPTTTPGVEEVLLNPEKRTRIPFAQVSRLMRTQLRWGVIILVSFITLIVATNVVFLLLPDLGQVEVAGIPLSWLIPPLVLTPLLMVLGRIYVRGAQRAEDELIRRVDQESRTSP